MIIKTVSYNLRCFLIAYTTTVMNVPTSMNIIVFIFICIVIYRLCSKNCSVSRRSDAATGELTGDSTGVSDSSGAAVNFLLVLLGAAEPSKMSL